jgi:membrane protein YdbS with pleckstrin-like domain
LRYGVLNVNNELLLFAKIQDIVISQNASERALGLSTVVVQNAGGNPETICGLEAGAAETLREQILRHVTR